jgi:putative membrane protein
MSPEIVDAIYAFGHYIGIGGLITCLAMETALMRADGITAHIPRLARFDRLLGMSATLIVLAGSLRVAYGLKGADYYLDYTMFWVKMALFFAAAAASIPPTMKFLRWQRSLRADPAFVPTERDLRSVRNHIKAEWALLLAIPAAAVVMARGI